MPNRSYLRGKPSLPTHVRDYNRRAVLQRVFSNGPISRAELAREIGLTKVTISALVSDLVDEGILTELGPDTRPGTPGKRPTLLSLSDNQRIVAVDLTRDGTLSGSITSLTGETILRTQPTRSLPVGDDGVTALTEFCQELIKLAEVPVLGVGVSSPGIITREGTVARCPKRGWYDVDLQELLSDKLALPVVVANDANLAALGEFAFGESAGANVLSIMVGDGIGAGLVIDGAMVLGQTNSAGEIAHITATSYQDHDAPWPEPPLCDCGRRGCIEMLLSEPELRAAIAPLEEDQQQAYLAAVGKRLGTILAPSVALLNLSDVILAGPADLLTESLLDATRAAISDNVWPSMNLIPTVRASQLDDRAPLVGAAVLVMSSLLGIP